jgi:exo-beta-1,3-glucanase (GH17 family)
MPVLIIVIYILIIINIVFMAGVGGVIYAEEESRVNVKIKDGWFYVNGKKFFIKGINYSGWRPGESPHDLNPVNLKLADYDFKMIKEAGFNTIRTAGGLTPELVALAKKHGLMVMHGIWFDKDIDYSDPNQIKYAIDMLKPDLSWSKDFDNIICYLVMNEPVMEKVREVGKMGTENFLRSLKDTVKTSVPEGIVSFANWVPLAFIEHSFLDAVCFNVYMYGPSTITHSLGYRGYIEWLKKMVAKDKPLVITEFGLSVSPQGIGESIPGRYSYGGNSLEEQEKANLKMYDDLIQAGAVGGCVFSWIDEWWMEGDKSEHDSHPEEYFGIVELDKNPKGTPRPVYYALKEYNQAIVIEPKKLNLYGKELPIEVYVTDQVGLVQFRLNNGNWQDLEKEGNLWRKTILDISKNKDGKHTLEIKALDKNNKSLCHKKQDLWIYNKSEPATIPYKVEITTDKEEYNIKEKMKLNITVTDAQGNPVTEQPVYYSFFQSIGWEEYVSQKVTDKQGKITTQFSTFTPGYLTIASGVAYKDGDYERVFGDVKTVLFK